MDKMKSLRLWIARDKDGVLRFWRYKPIKDGSRFMQGYYMGDLNRELYPEVTWENSPQKVELKLIEK